MSMPPEPLTPDERALAQSLSRLGPHGGPSPELDARILGAARAAVQTARATSGHVPPSRRRWPLRMGVAASVLLAAGVAWQLRPVHEIPIASEVPMATEGSVGVVSEEPDVAAADAAAPVDMPASPAIVAQEVAPPMPAKVLPPSPVGRATTASRPARQNAEAAARQEPAPKRGPLALIPAPILPAPPAPEAAPQAFPADDGFSRPPQGIVASPAAEADLQERAQYRAAAQQEQEQRARFDEQRRDAAAKADDSTTLDSVAVTGSRVKSRDRQARTKDVVSAPAPVAAAAPPPPPPPPPPAASAGSAQPSAARTALRRTDLQVPVDADTRLPPDEWLDRIRLRRDLGDNANALRSLQLFVQEHPFQRVPEDLRPLLGSP